LARLPIVDGIARYIEEDNAPFSMPGHKGGRGFLFTEEGKRLYYNLIRGDITEVEGMDNLHNAEGIIKEASELLSEFYGSKKSYFLVNGSTSGNLAMIFTSFSEGDKIIVERNCHRSIFNGIIMRKLRPIYVKNIISKKYNAPFSIDMEHFFQLLSEHEDVKGIIITYPNYYGVCVDLKIIIEEAKKRKICILIDSAHGAHFGIDEALPESAVNLGADIVVMSAHKTLPSLTQTAYLHAGNNVDIKKLNFYISAFTSTSPSYALLGSMDYARFFLETKGKETYRACLKIAKRYREKINQLEDFHIISNKDINDELNIKGINLDESRYIINVQKGYSGHLLLRYLREKGIQCEMSDELNVVLILSPFNIEADFEKLYQALKTCPMELLVDQFKEVVISELPKMILQPFEVMEKRHKAVKLSEAAGKVCANSIVPYPPGIPLVMPGELLDEESIALIEVLIKQQVTILGVDGDTVLVIE
jgi:arginine/lysine/ornithine decarboxylase